MGERRQNGRSNSPFPRREGGWGVRSSLILFIILATSAAQAQDYGTVFFIQGERGPSGDPGESAFACDDEGCRLGSGLTVTGDLTSSREECESTCGGDLLAGGDGYFETLEVGRLVVDQSIWLPECPPGYERVTDGVPEQVVLCRRGSDEMVKVGDIWVDRYEASVWQNPDCSGTQYGGVVDNWREVGGYDLRGSFPYHGQFTEPLYACSVAEVPPSRWITWFQAQAACAASGKHLITNAEWQAAVIGTVDPTTPSTGVGGTCNTAEGILRETGLGTACVSYWGVEDMIGNLWELTSDWYGQGGDEDDGEQSAEYFNDGFWNVDAAQYQGPYATHFPAMGWRGGCYNNTTRSGAFALALTQGPQQDRDAGFHCARSY
jgi:hypothetical protein